MKVYQRLLNVLLIALLLGALSVTFGQTITTGDVAGTVKDTTGRSFRVLRLRLRVPPAITERKQRIMREIIALRF